MKFRPIPLPTTELAALNLKIGVQSCDHYSAFIFIASSLFMQVMQTSIKTSPSFHLELWI